jgi:hypothetical protein
MAVMLIGTRLMLSSRRVAVTTISSKPPPVAAGSSVVASLARAAFAAQAATPTIRVRKNNICKEIGRLQGFELVACIVSPKISYIVR